MSDDNRTLHSVSHRLLRLEFLRQPDHIRAETRARAERLACDGSALRWHLAHGLHDREQAGELARLEAWVRGELRF